MNKTKLYYFDVLNEFFPEDIVYHILDIYDCTFLSFGLSKKQYSEHWVKLHRKNKRILSYYDSPRTYACLLNNDTISLEEKDLIIPFIRQFVRVYNKKTHLSMKNATKDLRNHGYLLPENSYCTLIELYCKHFF